MYVRMYTYTQRRDYAHVEGDLVVAHGPTGQELLEEVHEQLRQARRACRHRLRHHRIQRRDEGERGEDGLGVGGRERGGGLRAALGALALLVDGYAPVKGATAGLVRPWVRRRRLTGGTKGGWARGGAYRSQGPPAALILHSRCVWVWVWVKGAGGYAREPWDWAVCVGRFVLSHFLRARTHPTVPVCVGGGVAEEPMGWDGSGRAQQERVRGGGGSGHERHVWCVGSGFEVGFGSVVGGR